MSTVDNYLALAVGSWDWFSWSDFSLKPTGQPIILTYSFETQPAPDVRAIGGFTEAFWNSFQSLTEKQRAAAKAALDAWSAASGIIFVEAKPGMGDIRFGVYDFDAGGPNDSKHAGAYAFFPGVGLGGDVFVGKTTTDDAYTFLHEIGHALGLKHPFDGDPTLVSNLDVVSHTVMSYTHDTVVKGLGDLDKAAIAYLYGAAGTPMPGTWSWDIATQTLTQTNKVANALIHGVSSGNIIVAGDSATILPGGGGNTITAGDKAGVYWNGGAMRAANVLSTLTLGNDAKIIASFYQGSLKVTAGTGAQIDVPGMGGGLDLFLDLKLGAKATVRGGSFGGNTTIVAGDDADINLPSTPTGGRSPAISATVSVGANSKVMSAGFQNSVTITAGDKATISLAYLRGVTPDNSLTSRVTAGNEASIYAGDFVNKLVVRAENKANLTVSLGLSDVVVGLNSTVFVADWSALTPAADQVSRFTFGKGGSFYGTAALGTNVVVSAGDTNVFGGKGSEIVFTSGKNFFVNGGAGVDIVIIDVVAPSTAFSTSTSSDGSVSTYLYNGTGADGVGQYWNFQNTEYLEFSNALYSVAKKKYLADFTSLKVAYDTALHGSSAETSHLLIADLADRVDGGQITKVAAINEVIRAAGAVNLVTAYENIMDGPLTGKDATFVTGLVDKIGSGTLSYQQALDQVIDLADGTTSVATLAYEFFTGKIPGKGGIDYLVSATGPNANNLNSAYYQSFNLENRYINFAVNLGKVGEGKDAFLAKYGALNIVDATREAYKAIFGAAPTDAKIHAMIDSRIDYFAAYGGDGTGGIGTKAAMVGWLLAEAQKADLGVMVRSNEAWLADLSDGSAPYAVDILDPSKGYYKAEFIFGGA